MHTNTLVSLLAIAAVGFTNASPIPKSGVNGSVNGQSVPPSAVPAPANVGAIPDPKRVAHVPRHGDPTGQTGAQVNNVTPPGPNSTPAYIAAYHDAHGRRHDLPLPVDDSLPITPFDPTGTSGLNIDDLTPPTPGATPAYIEAYHAAGKDRREVSPPALPVKAPVKAPALPAAVPRDEKLVHASSHLDERKNKHAKPSKNDASAPDYPKNHLLDFVFSKVGVKTGADMTRSESIKPITEKIAV